MTRWCSLVICRHQVCELPNLGRSLSPPDETGSVRAIYERMAAGYDRMIATWERLPTEDGRR
jgi:hypothetical protein